MRTVLIVGFDLDMTLIDSRPGIRDSMLALSRATGVFIDADLVLTRLGPKLEEELAKWFLRGDVPAAAERYRDFYYDHCTGDGTRLLPGAHASIDAVRRRGGAVLAITAKSERLAQRCLETVDLAVDAVVGHVHGDEKRDALRAHNADVYVGDTIADVRAGVDAGALAVAVTTGMHTAHELAEAGATVVLRSLEEFPRWLDDQPLN